jgi:hypothetical protein
MIFMVNMAFGADYSIATPYDGNDLSLLQYAQLNDVMYIVHPDYQVRKLSRLAHNSWTIEAVDFEDGPFMAMNDTTTTITPTGTLTAGGNVTLTASSSIFDVGHVGSIWKIDQKRGSNTFQGKIDAAESSASTYYFTGTFSFITEGTFEGTVTLERSTNGSDWSSALTPLTNINYNNPGEFEDEGAYYRVTGSSWSSGACYYTITISDNYNHGTVKITGHTSGTVLTGTVVEPLYAQTATTRWFEPSFSDYRGWPRAIAFYQQRLLLAGTYHEPTTIWASRSLEPENFDLGTGLASHSLYYDITIARQNPILWLHDLDTVMVGTTGGIFKWGSMTAGEELTPSNATTRRLSGFGAAAIQPAFIGESLLFVERGGKKVYESSYRLEADGYVVNDLTLLATHLFEDYSIVETAVQMRPTPILWCLRSDGAVAGLSFLKQQGIIAWHRQITDGDIKSICCIPGTDEDELWLAVQRTIDGADVMYVEQMQPWYWGSDPNDCWYVDSGLKYSGVSTDTITGLDHLEGESVQVFKGDSYETATVSGGSITLSEAVTEATIGLGYTSTLTTMPLEIQTQQGFTIGKQKQVMQIFVAYEDTMAFEYSETTKENWYPVKNRYKESITEPTTGYSPMLQMSGNSDFEVSVSLRQQWPYPMRILAIYPDVDYEN